jgi:7-cyano-7-deazaguanine synthase
MVLLEMSQLLLLSGGIDSAALAAWLRPELSLTVDYGQRCAHGEIIAATEICRELGLDHLVLQIVSPELGSGDLAGKEPNPLAPAPEWWPFRNQFLITVGAMVAIEKGFRELLFGSVATDRVHADGGPAFFSAINRLLACQEGDIFVRTPALELSSEQVVKQSGIALEVLAWSHSCHTRNLACGECRGCRKHLQTFADLGIHPID